jgi:hypothetical protein
MFGCLGTTPIHIGGVTLYRVPLDQLGGYRLVDPSKVDAKIARDRVGKLIIATSRFVEHGQYPSEFNPFVVQQMGLLPPLWVSGVNMRNPKAMVQNGLILAPLGKTEVLMGIRGSRPILNQVANIYRPYAQKIELSPPRSMGANQFESIQWILLIAFDQKQLTRAADFARGLEATRRGSGISTEVEGKIGQLE